jgi:hypothetical protein
MLVNSSYQISYQDHLAKLLTLRLSCGRSSLHGPIDRLHTSVLTAINTFAYLHYVCEHTPASIGLGVFLLMSPLSHAANAGSIVPDAIGTVDALIRP